MNAIAAAPVIAGGWGVDALVARETRLHRDLDVLFPADLVDGLVQDLARFDFEVVTDWRPVRVELMNNRMDAIVDTHPALGDGAGGFWQHGLEATRFAYPATSITTGKIAGRSVLCLDAHKQLELHDGYVLGDKDRRDITVLTELVQG